MERLVLVIGIIIFCFLLLFEIFGHRKRSIRRKPLDWCFLCIIFAAIALCVFGIVRSFDDNRTDSTPGQYLAYHYLLDNDTLHASDAAVQDDLMTEREKTLIGLFVLALDKDYQNLYYEAKEFTGSEFEDSPQADYADRLYTLAMTAINDEKNISRDVRNLLKERCESIITETPALESYYELDSRIKNNDAESVDAGEITTLLTRFPDDSTAMKLAISYYAERGMFEAAFAQCNVLLEKYDKVSNRIILTDLLAQQAYQSTDEQFNASEDSEILGLAVKAQEAAAKSESAGSDSKSEKQQESVYEYYEQAETVTYQRIINYTDVRIAGASDGSGLYELAGIKAKLLAGRYEEALSEFNELLQKASLLDKDSPIRDALLNVRAVRDNFLSEEATDETSQQLYYSVKKLMRHHSENVVSVDDETVNSRTAALLYSLLRYDEEQMNITYIDTTAAKLAVGLNMNIGKENIFGRTGEFYADDMIVTDNGVQVDSISVAASIGTGDRSLSIAYAVEKESRAEDIGSALRTLRSGSAAKKYALIGSSGEVNCAFGDSADHYMIATRNLGQKKSSSLFDILCAAIAEMTDNNVPEKNLLYISDGDELNSEQLNMITATAAENEISIYAVVIKGGDEESAAALAESTGGAYSVIYHENQIYAALDSIVSLMNNTYEITFKPDDEEAATHRIKVELISAGLSAEKEVPNEKN